LLAENPRLVYCSLSGYGRSGPLASRAGHDLNYLSRSGLLGGSRGGDGRPAIAAAQLADMSGGLYAVIGILAALQARERTGRGQRVDVSLLAAAFGLMTIPMARLVGGGSAVNELTGVYACYNVYRCRDGRYVSVGALEPKFWEALCKALGHEDRTPRQWEKEPGRGETIALFARTFAERDRDEWVKTLAPADCCVEPVLEPEEAVAAAEAAGAFVEQPAGSTRFKAVRPPFALAGTPTGVSRPAPGPGQHTDEVLREAGYSAAELARLREQGVLA
jgi:crotonobetainyl-CoA:carnitine CoA-transferase CaiB-like acyl-CoA transferase